MHSRTKNGNLKVSFEAYFQKPPIYDLDLTIDLDVRQLSETQVIRKTYYRRKQCPVCQGKGGLDGHTRECTLCEGKGYTLHKFQRSDFLQVIYSYNHLFIYT